MIEVPLDLERLLKDQVARSGVAIIRDEPVELQCQTDEWGDAIFLIYGPKGERMHMLAPKTVSAGQA